MGVTGSLPASAGEHRDATTIPCRWNSGGRSLSGQFAADSKPSGSIRVCHVTGSGQLCDGRYGTAAERGQSEDAGYAGVTRTTQYSGGGNQSATDHRGADDRSLIVGFGRVTSGR